MAHEQASTDFCVSQKTIFPKRSYAIFSGANFYLPFFDPDDITQRAIISLIIYKKRKRASNYRLSSEYLNANGCYEAIDRTDSMEGRYQIFPTPIYPSLGPKQSLLNAVSRQPEILVLALLQELPFISYI